MWGKGGRILVHPWLWGQPQPGGQLPGLMQWGERVGCDSLCHQLAWLCFGVLGCGTARNQILGLLNLPRCRPLHSLAPFRNWQFLGLPLKKTDPSEARREKLYCLPWPSQHQQQTGSKHPQGSTSAVEIKKIWCRASVKALGLPIAAAALHALVSHERTTPPARR